MLLILVIALVVFVQMAGGNAPDDAQLTLDVFKVEPGTDTSTLFLGIIFGLLSFAGFEAAATLGEEAHNPRRDIPRAILGTAIFGGDLLHVRHGRRDDGLRHRRRGRRDVRRAPAP